MVLAAKPGRRVAARAQVLGQRRVSPIERGIPVHPQLMRPSAGEDGRVGGERPGGRGAGLVEANAPPGQPLEHRGRRAPITIEAQMVGPDGVERDQQHVRRVAGRQRAARLANRRQPVPANVPAGQDQDEPQQAEEAEERTPAQDRGRAAQGRGEEGGDPRRQDDPGDRVDPRADHHQHRQDSQEADDPRAEPAAGSRP